MILRTIDSVAMIITGLIMGYVLASSSKQGLEEISEEPAVAVSRLSAEPLKANKSQPMAIGASECPEFIESTMVKAESTPQPLPEAYLEIVGPFENTKRPLETYDRFVAFAHDDRDESWAAAMEAGIANFAARQFEIDGTLVDFVECRSRFCVIAGHSPTGQTARFGSIRGEGWWQATGPAWDSMTSGRDGSVLYILIYERFADGQE